MKIGTINLPGVRVSNMKSPNGHDVPNQFEISTDDGIFFQSYESIIAYMPKDTERFPNKTTSDYKKIVLDRHYWNYSRTTSKYRSQFLGESTKETQAKIDQGIYLLGDLN